MALAALPAASRPAAASGLLRHTAARSFSSSMSGSRSSSSSSSSSSLGLRWLAMQQGSRGGGARSAVGCRLAAAGAPPGSAAARQLQQLRLRTDSAHLVPKFAGKKMKPYS